MRLLPSLLSIAVALAAAGCAADDLHAPARETPPPDLTGHAFLLTIDVATGRVDVAAPRPRSTAAGASLSLLGTDAIRVEATACTFTAIPKNKKQKRCTLDITLTNLLQHPLATPSFPAPPAGTNGILVFPYTAAAQTVSGGSAVANDLWDNAPANFFNDFDGCSGKSSDCYRSETFPMLLAGERSAARTVGFDVDVAAQQVSAYLVVAADLGREAVLAGIGSRCGYIREGTTMQPENEYVVSPDADLQAGSVHDDPRTFRYLGFCGFDRSTLPAGARVIAAKLRLTQNLVVGTPFESGANVVVDHVDLGADFDETDFGAAALQANIGIISSDASLGIRELDVTGAVLDDVADGRSRSEFRVRLETTGLVSFTRVGQPGEPQLVVVYTE